MLPHHRSLRPAWLLRLGLFLYDHLSGRRRLPATRTVQLRRDAVGAPLKPEYTLGFEYSDCWVEDSRLTVLNARDAADRGAVVASRTECMTAQRVGAVWTLEMRDVDSGARQTVKTRTLINAAGPWVAQVANAVVRANVPASVRLVQGSHIVVRKLYDHDACYIFQNADKRIFFVIPYERDFTLIGTTDEDFTGELACIQASPDEIAYLCRSASEYLRTPVTPAMVVWTYSGLRPLYDDGSAKAQEATRDYVLQLDAPEAAGALLSVFGGKITTYRRLAESALAELAPHLPPARGAAPGWTGKAALPGGDFPVDGFDAQVRALRERYPFLEAATATRLVRAYGTRAAALLGDAASAAELGTRFGADLTEAELRYLARQEWARTAEDVVWRRSKLGLRLDAAQIAAVDEAMRRFWPDRQEAA